MPSFTALLIDDHAMLRTGLAMVIRAALPGAVVLEAQSLEEAMRIESERMAVVLLDVQLPGLNGFECIAPLRRRWPETKVVMLSSHDDPGTVRMAHERGACQFVSKSQPASRLVDAIREVLSSEHGFGATVPGALEPRAPTPRQCEVLDLLNQGLSNKAIARRLELSDNTVRRHVQDLLVYFEVGSRAEAVFAARRLGMMS